MYVLAKVLGHAPCFSYGVPDCFLSSIFEIHHATFQSNYAMGSYLGDFYPLPSFHRVNIYTDWQEGDGYR